MSRVTLSIAPAKSAAAAVVERTSSMARAPCETGAAGARDHSSGLRLELLDGVGHEHDRASVASHDPP